MSTDFPPEFGTCHLGGATLTIKSNSYNQVLLLIKLVNIKKLLISKRRIGILKKLPKQGEDSESL